MRGQIFENEAKREKNSKHLERIFTAFIVHAIINALFNQLYTLKDQS